MWLRMTGIVIFVGALCVGPVSYPFVVIKAKGKISQDRTLTGQAEQEDAYIGVSNA